MYDPSVFKNQKVNEIQVRKPFFLYIGSRESYKGFQDLLETYSRYKDCKIVDLVIVGNLLTTEEKHFIANLGILNNVQNLWNISDEQLSMLYNQASAFIYPSRYEGFGIPLLEAMACGCPIIASSIPSTIEIARDVPIYFEPGSNESLMNALEQNSIEGRDSPRIAKGMETAKKYSWEKSALETLDVYKALDNN